MLGSIGMPELVVILVLALLIFGPRKLPELGRSLGRTLTEFRRASQELQRTLEDDVRIEQQAETAAATPVTESSRAGAGSVARTHS
jgi:sec-independent protein translocase protein TatA